MFGDDATDVQLYLEKDRGWLEDRAVLVDKSNIS
jgi:hypothetical protein